MTDAFKGAVLSFYSGSYYGELAHTRKGIGIGLVFVLTLILTVMIMLCVLFNLGTLQNVMHVVSQKISDLPDISIKDGKLSAKPDPYQMSLNDESASFRIIIDTSYKLNDSTLQYMRKNNIYVLFAADEFATLLSNDKKLEINDYYFKDNRSFTITHEDWLKMADRIEHWGMPVLLGVIFIMGPIVLFMGNFLATVLTAIAVWLVGLIVQAGLEFADAMRLTAALRIPVSILGFLPVFVGGRQLHGLADWGIWLIYLVFAVYAARHYRNSAAG